MLTRLAVALVQLAFTTAACVARGTGTGEAGDAIHTAPMMAGVRGAVIHIILTQWALKACHRARQARSPQEKERPSPLPRGLFSIPNLQQDPLRGPGLAQHSPSSKITSGKREPFTSSSRAALHPKPYDQGPSEAWVWPNTHPQHNDTHIHQAGPHT